MKLDIIRTYMLDKQGATEERPFGPQALVFKVVGKMFALVAWEETPPRVTLKCDPDLAPTWRNQFRAVQPGYYMNKKHWNSVTLDGSIPDEVILGMVDDSYNLVVKGLKKADRQRLQSTQI